MYLHVKNLFTNRNGQVRVFFFILNTTLYFLLINRHFNSRLRSKVQHIKLNKLNFDNETNEMKKIMQTIPNFKIPVKYLTH